MVRMRAPPSGHCLPPFRLASLCPVLLLPRLSLHLWAGASLWAPPGLPPSPPPPVLLLALPRGRPRSHLVAGPKRPAGQGGKLSWSQAGSNGGHLGAALYHFGWQGGAPLPTVNTVRFSGASEARPARRYPPNPFVLLSASGRQGLPRARPLSPLWAVPRPPRG